MSLGPPHLGVPGTSTPRPGSKDANPEGPPASMDVPEASTAPILVTRLTITMVISTSMGGTKEWVLLVCQL